MAKKRGNTVTRMQVRAHKRDLRTNGGQQWMANAYYGGFGSRPQHDRDLVRHWSLSRVEFHAFARLWKDAQGKRV